MSDKTKELITNYFGYFIVALTCILYVLTTVFILSPTSKTLGQIIGEGILAFCMGISINHLLSVQGVINAMKSEVVNNTMTAYSNTVVKISPNINKLGEWCNNKNNITYKRQRIKILARGGLKYDDYFDEDGTAKSFDLDIDHISKEKKKEYKFKKKCYWKAVNLKLSELYPSNLTSEGGKKDDPNYLGQTINEYMTVSSMRDILSKIFLAVIFGVYGIKLIENFSYINLIWTGFQICTFLCFGVIKMRASYMFITTDYRGRIIKKIDNLEEFDADITKGVKNNE